MTKLETLIVPVELGEWLQSREMGKSEVYFSTIDSLFHYWDTSPYTSVYNFISQNKKELIEVILGSRGYRVDEPLYQALIKGHEVTNSYYIYWNYDKSDDGVFVSILHPLNDNLITEMSKSEWNELGINDSNADFVKV